MNAQSPATIRQAAERAREREPSPVVVEYSWGAVAWLGGVVAFLNFAMLYFGEFAFSPWVAGAMFGFFVALAAVKFDPPFIRR